MTQKLACLFGLLSIVLLTSFADDPDFPQLPKIKTITEWKEWADTSQYHESKKWLKSRREYYPNGEIQRKLYVGYEGDTTDLRIYNLNKDSTIDKEIWYNKFLNEWIEGNNYFYYDGEKHPYMTSNQDNYKCHYSYDINGRLAGKLFKEDNNISFAEHEYNYDANGLLVGQIEYDFFNEQREVTNVYVYSYEKNSTGQVIKKEMFLV